MDTFGIPFRVYEVQGDDGKTSTTKWTSLDGMFSKRYNLKNYALYFFRSDSITKNCTGHTRSLW